MKIAITGSNGFLASFLIPLIENGHTIISISRSTGIDILKMDTMENLPHFDLIIHLAAKSYVPDAYSHPHDFYMTNCVGTLNVVETARVNQAKVIYISSYVYGHPEYLPIDEVHKTSAFNPYAQSKLIGEQICEGYARDFNMDITILRPFNIYGPSQPSHFLISKIVELVKAGGEVEIFDDRPKRDYIHAKDVALAIKAIVEKQEKGLNIYNVGFGKSYTSADIVSALETISGDKIVLKNLMKHRPNEIMDTVCNNQKLSRHFNWSPSISLEEGLKEIFESN